ncbi:developmentally regulated GTP-binding protein [Perkinsela sp. CCAP 1560/4]|nr:developmentally regulated GTP-binding protein [Perkinsela sp. CCAP 1560/4]|eukprot:KNH06828.1 developmentally regulated GTP-binding protein [Perkinsela sp. CCAP 1560/4]
MSVLQKIADIEAEMARTQKNKATMGHIGQLKARLAALKRDLLAQDKSKSGGGKSLGGFDVSKTGDARIGFIGFPSVGKSTLLNKLTDSELSEAAAYEFTTLTCVPGVTDYNGARIQLLDLPGIIEGAKDGKGRGRQVIATARTCGLLLIVLDCSKPLQHKLIIERELEGFGIRLNRDPPDISVKRKESGGVAITYSSKQSVLDDATIRAVLAEYKIISATVHIRGTRDYTIDDLIDAIEGNRIYVPCVFVLNKVDRVSIAELEVISELPYSCAVSADQGWNLDGLMEYIWERLNMIRVYTKPKGQIPDYKTPVILKKSPPPTLEKFCSRIHKHLITRFRYAWVWGSSVKHNPQKVGKEHRLEDEDVVQIVKRI